MTNFFKLTTRDFVLTVIFTVLISFSSFAQLSGVKTIPGDFATVKTAIDSLNLVGVASGGVTFNVAAGYTESITSPIILTATGTSSDPVVFQKSGAGLNPVITRTDAGTLATSVLGGQGDAVIIIEGSDYVTFDGVDVNASDAGIEYGYYLRKANGVNGCKYVTIKNSVVDMSKGASAFVVGIYASNNDASSAVGSATGITITSVAGRNENVSITGNTIQDVFTGIVLISFNHTVAPYDFQDQNFVVGASGAGNRIQNFAGNTAQQSYGIYLINHTNSSISYNTINNIANGGTNATSTINAIYRTRSATTNPGGYAVMNNNDIILGQSSTSAIYGIYDNQNSDSIVINNNTFGVGTFASTASSYLTYLSNTTPTVSFINNTNPAPIVKTGASGTFYGYYHSGSPTVSGTETVANNNFSNVTLSGSAGCQLLYSSIGSVVDRIAYNNSITNITGSGSGLIYGPYFTLGNNSLIYNNTTHSLSGGGTIYGLYFSGVNPTVYNNTVYNLTTSGSTLYGVYDGGSGTTNCYKNNIYNLTSNTATTSLSLYGINIATGTNNYVYNNFISSLYAPTSASVTGPR